MSAADLAWGYEGDYFAVTYDLTYSQWRDLPGWEAWIQTVANAGQRFEAATFDLLLGRTLERASGTELAWWGDLVGEPAGALTEAEHRAFLEGRFLVNAGSGTVDQLTTIAATIMQGTGARYFGLAPNGYILDVYVRGAAPDRVLRRAQRTLQQAKPAGKAARYQEVTPGTARFDDVSLGWDEGTWARGLTDV